jgi:hypothetical protein
MFWVCPIGIAYCILIALYIQDEFNYEKGFRDYKRIFRINTTQIHDGIAVKISNTAPPIAPGLAEVLPEVEIATRTMRPPGVSLSIGCRLLPEHEQQWWEVGSDTNIMGL